MAASKQTARSVGLKKQADGRRGYTYRIEPEVLKALKIHALHNDLQVKDIFAQAISDWMEKHNVSIGD